MRTDKELEDLIKHFLEAAMKPDATNEFKTTMAMGISVANWVLNKREIKTFSEIEKDPKAWNDWIKNALQP